MAINQKSKNKTVFLPEKEFKCTNSTACFNMGWFVYSFSVNKAGIFVISLLILKYLIDD